MAREIISLTFLLSVSAFFLPILPLYAAANLIGRKTVKKVTISGEKRGDHKF